jgi:hypothetical protein
LILLDVNFLKLQYFGFFDSLAMNVAFLNLRKVIV